MTNQPLALSGQISADRIKIRAILSELINTEMVSAYNTKNGDKLPARIKEACDDIFKDIASVTLLASRKPNNTLIILNCREWKIKAKFSDKQYDAMGNYEKLCDFRGNIEQRQKIAELLAKSHDCVFGYVELGLIPTAKIYNTISAHSCLTYAEITDFTIRVVYRHRDSRGEPYVILKFWSQSKSFLFARMAISSKLLNEIFGGADAYGVITLPYFELDKLIASL